MYHFSVVSFTLLGFFLTTPPGLNTTTIVSGVTTTHTTGSLAPPTTTPSPCPPPYHPTTPRVIWNQNPEKRIPITTDPLQQYLKAIQILKANPIPTTARWWPRDIHLLMVLWLCLFENLMYYKDISPNKYI